MHFLGDRLVLERPNITQSYPLLDQDLISIGRVFKFKFQYEKVTRRFDTEAASEEEEEVDNQAAARTVQFN